MGLAACVLLFRRLPSIMALYRYIPAIRDWRQAVFAGWFGPIGVGALFYYTIAIESFPSNGETTDYARQVIEPIIYFMILASVAVHGCTIPFYLWGSRASRTLTRSGSSCYNANTSDVKISPVNSTSSYGATEHRPTTVDNIIWCRLTTLWMFNTHISVNYICSPSRNVHVCTYNFFRNKQSRLYIPIFSADGQHHRRAICTASVAIKERAAPVSPKYMISFENQCLKC